MTRNVTNAQSAQRTVKYKQSPTPLGNGKAIVNSSQPIMPVSTLLPFLLPFILTLQSVSILASVFYLTFGAGDTGDLLDEAAQSC